MHITLKRAYEPPAPDDGVRILVERLWPRGITKADAAIDHWLKDIAPSPDLRRWYGHRPQLWPEFSRRYQAELTANRAGTDAAMEICAGRRVTFVFAARDTERNSAIVLRDHLLGLDASRQAQRK